MKKFIIIFLVVCTQNVCAQDNELLFHYNRHKEHIYKVGDVIAFRLKGNDEKHQGQITAITDSTIVFGKEAIKPDQVSHIYIDKATRAFFAFRYKWARLFLFAGVGYIALDVANRRELDPGTAIIAGSLLGAAALTQILIKDYIKLKRPRKLVILRD